MTNCLSPFSLFLYFLLFWVVPSLSHSFCYQPWVPENGHVIFAEPGPYAPGTVARYSCALGFERVGAEERTCQWNGRWSGQSPLCAIDISKTKPCEQSTGGPPEGPTNAKCTLTDNEKRSWWAVDLLGEFEIHSIGIRLGSNSSPLESIELLTSSGGTHSCDISAYSFSSNQTVSVKCRGNKVTRVVVTATSRLHICQFQTYATNAVSAWQCAIGQMDMIGVLDGMCYSASKEDKTDWKGAQGRCLDKGASLPMRITTAARRGLRSALSNNNFGASFYWIGLFSANSEWRWADGQSIVEGEADWPEDTVTPTAGNSEAILLARPLEWRWIPAAQTAWNPYICQSKPKFCTSPGVGEAGRVAFSSHSYAIGTQCFYSCEDGFKLHGDQNRECREGGRWSGNIPKCRRMDCGDPGPWSQGHIHFLNGTTLFEAQVEYICSAGYDTIGERKRVCRSDGLWDGREPECEVVDCGRPPSIANGQFTITNTTVNGSATYICNDNHRLIGHDVIFCTDKALWEPSSPVCYDVATLRDMKGSNAGEGNAYLAILAVLLLAILVVAVIKVSRPSPPTVINAPPTEHNKYTPSPVQQVIYATPTGLPAGLPQTQDNVVYYATSAPITQLEIPPQLLRLQQLPNGNIHVTLPLGRPVNRPPVPIFNPHSPTPSQLLYSFDHEPFYDIPPEDFDPNDQILVPPHQKEEEEEEEGEGGVEENIYERVQDPKTP